MNDGTRTITPIFIFSLGRSGSTLTQRILATHPEIETASEPWVLVPLLYSMRSEGIYSVYSHRVAYKAIEDFCSDLPGGVNDYLQEIKELALRFYARKAKSNARYFLDKTPRYHVVASQIMQMFPESPCIFLWRNPLAIAASIIETWGNGRWNLYEFEFDLFDGLESLVEACQEAGDRACSVRYEDIIGETSDTRERVFRYLALPFDEAGSVQISDVKLTGRMGDQAGVKKYSAVSRESKDNWREVLASPIRKMWCRRYLRWIGRDRLNFIGYELDGLLSDLDAVPNRFGTVISDIWRMMFGMAVKTFEPWIMRDKLARMRRGQRLRIHN